MTKRTSARASLSGIASYESVDKISGDKFVDVHCGSFTIKHKKTLQLMIYIFHSIIISHEAS